MKYENLTKKQKRDRKKGNKKVKTKKKENTKHSGVIKEKLVQKNNKE